MICVHWRGVTQHNKMGYTAKHYEIYFLHLYQYSTARSIPK